MTTTSLLPDVGIELREGYAEVGDQSLHYVEAGDGPLIVLLHGFPEFWFGWRLQIAPVERVKTSPQQLHVLLRHRPRSIPQAQESA